MSPLPTTVLRTLVAELYVCQEQSSHMQISSTLLRRTTSDWSAVGVMETRPCLFLLQQCLAMAEQAAHGRKALLVQKGAAGLIAAVQAAETSALEEV